jgi:hypothetical protein
MNQNIKFIKIEKTDIKLETNPLEVIELQPEFAEERNSIFSKLKMIGEGEGEGEGSLSSFDRNIINPRNNLKTPHTDILSLSKKIDSLEEKIDLLLKSMQK